MADDDTSTGGPSSLPAPKRLGRAARAVRAVAVGVVGIGLFATSLVGGLILHLDLPLARRVVQQTVNELFVGLFDGDVRVGAVEEITLDSIVVARFEAIAPTGERVIDVEGVVIRGSWLPSVLGLALRGGAGMLALEHVRVERGFVGLTIADDVPLPLAAAFGTGPSEPQPVTVPREPFVLEVDTVELGEVSVKGTLAPAVPIDATVSRLRAGLRVGEEGITVDVDRSAVEERAIVGARLSGSADYHLVGRFGEGDAGSLAMWGTFGGHLADLELTVNVLIDDGDVRASIDLPNVGPKQLAPWVPNAPLTRPVSARLGLSGRPPRLALSGRLDLPAIAGAAPGRVGLEGLLVADERVTVDAVVDVDELDARLLSDALPPTQLSARAQASLVFAGADTDVRVVVDGRRGRWGDLVVPPVEGVVAVAGGRVTGELVVDEEGAVTDVYASYDPDDGLTFASRSQVASLAEVPRLVALLGPTRLGGRASIRTTGRFVPGGELDVHAEADVAGVRVPAADVVVGGGRAVARLRGPSANVDELRLDATVTGGSATLGGTKVERFRVSAVGPLLRPTVDIELVDGMQREVRAKGVLDPRAKQLSRVNVAVDAGPVSISGEVDRVASVGESIRLDGLRLSGLGGEVTGELAVERGELVGQLEGSGIELGALSRMLGVRLPVRGHANLSVDLERAPGGRRGHVQLRVQEGGALLLDGVEVSLDTQFDGNVVEAEAALTIANPLRHEDPKHPCAGRVVTVTLEDAETALDGPLLDPATWRAADFTGMIGLESVNLRCVAEVWQEASPLAPIPITEVAGVLDASFGIAVVAEDPYPSLTHMGIKTTGLVLAGRPSEPEQEPPWKTDRLDLAVVGSLDGGEGDARLSVALLDDDRKVAENLTRPPLLRLDAAMKLDLGELVAGGERARTSLENSPMSLALETTRSPFARWAAIPLPWRNVPSRIVGDVEVDLFVEGTARDPSFAGRARAWGLTPPRAKDAPGYVKNDLDVIVSYQGGVGRIDGTLHRDGELALELAGESHGNLSTRLLGGGYDPRWTGWLAAELKGLRLSTVPPLAKLGMEGAVSGRVEVRGLGEDPRANVDLTITGLAVGPALRFAPSKVQLKPLEDGTGMSLLLDLPLEGGGGLRASGYGGLDWEDELYPAPAVDRAAGLYVIADRFPLAAARPFVPDAVAGLSGSLSGELRVGYKETSTREVAITMDMWLRDGAAQLVPLGQDFHGVTAHVTSRGGLVKVDDLELRSGSGRATGSFRAGLDGLGLNVVTGTIAIDDSEPFPVASEGVPLGNVTGQIDANVSVRDDSIEALLVTRGVRLQLPPSANRDVQELETHPDVVIAQPLAAPTPDEDEDEGGPSTPLTLTIVLSPTEIVGNQVRIAFLTEQPLHVRDDGTVKGEIVVTDGELTVLDKTFRVDRGTVRLREEEPGNPYLSVTAHWDAPDGTTVYVDYVGPLKPMDRENFTFRSQPAMPESDVLALLIFGDASAGAAGTEQTNSVANSVAAAQFNAVLGQLAPGLSTKISTNSATLTYQLTDQVTLSATFENQQGLTGEQGTETTSTGGGNPNDATNRSEFSIGYRFAKSWLVRGTVGVGLGAASGIDLLFQHRY